MQPNAALPAIAAIAPADVAPGTGRARALLALNNAHATELSPLGPDRLAALVAMAFAALRVGEAEALLLAFDQDAAYDSANFAWFRVRYDRFVYVDRVVVAPQARGRGLARALYARLLDLARAAGHDRILCEVNATPPNPVSDAFHAAAGFAPVGTGALPGGKEVRYLALDLTAETRP